MEKQLDTLSFSHHAEIGKDPWNELIQSSCVDSIEAGSMVRPLVLSARKNYRFLRDLWSNANVLPLPSILKNPVIQTFQPSQAIAFLLAQKWECVFPPLSLKQFPSGSALLANEIGDPENPLPTLAELCQLVLLWWMGGFETPARSLIQWLIPLADTPVLWCPENEFDENETLISFSLLFRAIGDIEKANELFQGVQKPIDPFFLKLARSTPRIDEVFSRVETVEDPYLGLKFFKSKKSATAFTLTGAGSSLGMLRLKEVEIRAFGPQRLPLSEKNSFGIFSLPDGNPLQGWSRCLALPEVWIGMKNENGSRIDLKFVGLTPQEPLAIVFYAKALSCQIGSAVYKPKSLQRYMGETDCLSLQGRTENLKIETAFSHKVQVIPLSGEGSFWNADFLISFEIHPVAAAATFFFSSASQ